MALTKTVFEIDKDEFLQTLKEFRKQEVEEAIYSKWSARTVDTYTACQILDVSEATLYRYVEEGRIKANNREAGQRKLTFQLSNLLSVDIAKYKSSKTLKPSKS